MQEINANVAMKSEKVECKQIAFELPAKVVRREA